MCCFVRSGGRDIYARMAWHVQVLRCTQVWKQFKFINDTQLVTTSTVKKGGSRKS